MSRKRWMKWIAEESANAEFVMPWERSGHKTERRIHVQNKRGQDLVAAYG